MTKPVQTIDVLLAEHADLERRLADPELHSNPDEARKAGRRFARLAPIVGTYRKLMAAREDLEAARELAADDDSFAAEAKRPGIPGGQVGHPAHRHAGPARPARRRRHRARGQIR